MKLDMHCHLDLYRNPNDIITTCNEKGLYILSITTTPKAYIGTNRLVANSKRIKTALGLHPELAHLRYEELGIFDILLPQVKYVGEIGLDGGNDYKEHANIQLKVFRHILKKVHSQGGRIMSIHSRGSAEKVVEELKGIDGIPIFHWFTGSETELRNAVDIGAWFSVGPAMLNSVKGKRIIELIPKDRLLTETDGPFAKYSGKNLFPWDVDKAITGISKLWGCTSEFVEGKIEENFRNILQL
ncbi:Qat anti-phage system TatD family nuclease QatD [Photorhabdus akhurstii]|uniref:Qat anti-phage system TatD family nuclease QatD n=1 Tax=Photorhabdus akhurstii TaxID=171438 RepID=UPI0009E274FB|nr:Qat anti-phage system TatD family nuclease QatD [Photorhabdus akhurstii]MBS9428233.1 TatD family deoxyribonuclease [Photorhabdus akhurstii]